MKRDLRPNLSPCPGVPWPFSPSRQRESALKIPPLSAPIPAAIRGGGTAAGVRRQGAPAAAGGRNRLGNGGRQEEKGDGAKIEWRAEGQEPGRLGEKRTKKGRSAIGAPPRHLHKDIVNSDQATALRQAGLRLHLAQWPPLPDFFASAPVSLLYPLTPTWQVAQRVLEAKAMLPSWQAPQYLPL